MYDLCKSNMAPYLTEEALEMCRHGYNTQRNEAMNQATNKRSPKSIDYSRTNSLHGRLSLTAGCVTLGNETFFRRTFKDVFPHNSATRRYLSSSTARKRKCYEYKQKLHVKRRRREEKRNKIKVSLKERRKDKSNGTIYQRGIATYFNGGLDVNKPSSQPTSLPKNDIAKIS